MATYIQTVMTLFSETYFLGSFSLDILKGFTNNRKTRVIMFLPEK